MQRYNINNRLAYLSGGVQSAGGMWPSVAAGDWWDVAGETCLIAYQPKGAASYADSLINLANPGTYNAAAGTAPAWDATDGWQFDRSSSHYLTTGWAPGASGDYTAIIRLANRNITTQDQVMFGSRAGFSNQGAFYMEMTMSFASTWCRGWWGGDDGFSTSSATSGVWALTPTASYVNKTSAAITTGSWATNNYNVYIGCFNNYTAGAFFYSTVDVLAFAIYDGAFTSGQISDLTDAMNAL